MYNEDQSNTSVVLLFLIGIIVFCFMSSNADAQSYDEYNQRLINETELSDEARVIAVIKNHRLNDFFCLATVGYFEARGSTDEDQTATMLVVRNRARQRNTSICHEAWRKYQFSGLIANRYPTEQRAWLKSQGIAFNVLDGRTFDITLNADHYHRHDINPKWSAAGVGKKRIGAHVYMKLKREF
jgi:spore germination cell wall hydrolase CwlJ-like protein